jgi:hypothetical protein
MALADLSVAKTRIAMLEAMHGDAVRALQLEREAHAMTRHELTTVRRG